MPASSITLADITSADWSLTLDANSTASTNTNQILSGSGIGNVVQGVTDINQCIGIILSTPKGSDPLRPNFACDIWQLIDAPLSVARPQLVRDITEAITIWEPRVQLISVTVSLPSGTISNLIINIVWQLAINPQITIGTTVPPQALIREQQVALTVSLPSSTGQPIDIASIQDVSLITDWSAIHP